MKDGGFAPDFLALFARDPLSALATYCAPMHAALIHLSTPEREEAAIATITRHGDPWMIYFSGLLLLVKYTKLDQLTRFPRVRTSRPYRALTDSYRRYVLNRTTWTRRTEQYAAALD